MQVEQNWISLGGFKPKRYRPGGIGNWSGHLPFAADLIRELRPALLVELGTHYGESYFGLCQAVSETAISCSCYAIDTWVGEEHSGVYDDAVYEEVERYNSAHYSHFSYLLRTTFNEAIDKFADESIDLLHIDGLHTYSAVSQDLALWYAKVKPGGIILMHDIMGRHADFGVWKVWEEAHSLGARFAFTHGWGLGVLQKAGGAESGSFLLNALFNAPAALRDHLRYFYSLAAIKLEYERVRERPPVPAAASNVISVQVFPFGQSGYASDTSLRLDCPPNQWHRIVVPLPHGLGKGALRFDPAEQPGIFDLASIALRRAADNEAVWRADRPADVASLFLGGTLGRAATSDREYCRYISCGSDPQLFLPDLQGAQFDQPLQLEVWFRIFTDLPLVLGELLETDQRRERSVEVAALQNTPEVQSEDLTRQNKMACLEAQNDELKAQLVQESAEYQLVKAQMAREIAKYGGVKAELNMFRAERDTLITEREGLKAQQSNLDAEIKRITGEKQQAISAQELLSREYASLLAGFRQVQSELYVCRETLKVSELQGKRTQQEWDAVRTQLQQELEAVRTHATKLQEVINGVLVSKSWRTTAPLRRLLERTRK